MADPKEILENALRRARSNVSQPLIADETILARVIYIARCLTNRAGVRMILTCTLAKIHRPTVDLRKPYTEIGGEDSFSGRAG